MQLQSSTIQSDKNASLCKEPRRRRKKRKILNGLHTGKLTIYMRKSEIVIGKSKFVPIRRLERTENVGCRLSQSNFSTLLSLSNLFRYSLKRVLPPQCQIQLLNVYKRDIQPDDLCKW